MISSIDEQNILDMLLEMKPNIISRFKLIIINFPVNSLNNGPIKMIQKDMYQLILINSLGNKFLHIKIISANNIVLDSLPRIRQKLEPLKLRLIY